MFVGIYPANFISKGNHTLQICPFVFLFFFLLSSKQAVQTASSETVNKKIP